MNRRIKKKKNKQLQNWIKEHFDVLDDNGNWHSVEIRCRLCQNFESGDPSVGLEDGCIAPFLFDKNGDFIESQNNTIIKHMGNLGYGCPYFKKKEKLVKTIK